MVDGNSRVCLARPGDRDPADHCGRGHVVDVGTSEATVKEEPAVNSTDSTLSLPVRSPSDGIDLILP